MVLFYEGVDITDDVDIVKCVHRDVSGGRCDSLEIVLEDAGAWYSWAPKKGDRIEAAMGSYTTGIMYFNAAMPEDGKFKIIATSTPESVYRKAWRSFDGMTLGGIMSTCAAECGIGWGVFGLDENMEYQYLIRKNEGCAAFLQRLMQWEGAQLKTINGKFMGIGIEYAQDLRAKQIIELTADQPGVKHVRRDSAKYASVRIKTPYADVKAEDADASANADGLTYGNLPAKTGMEAGRWARGLLLTNNRMAEELTIQSEFNAGVTAMARIDIDSPTETGGEWIVDEAVHDFIEGKTKAKLLRCLREIR